MRPRTLLTRLGIQNGAVIGSFDGKDLSTPERALEAHAVLMDRSTVGVRRRRAPVTITYRTALRGAINYQATGRPDPSPESSRDVAFKGKVTRIVYDPVTDVVYGLDPANRTLARIELASGAATYADVEQVPQNACMDTKRQSLFVVNQGSSLVSQYKIPDLSHVRDIVWGGTVGTTVLQEKTHFEIYCAPDRVYLADAAWSPSRLSTTPTDVTEHQGATR